MSETSEREAASLPLWKEVAEENAQEIGRLRAELAAARREIKRLHQLVPGSPREEKLREALTTAEENIRIDHEEIAKLREALRAVEAIATLDPLDKRRIKRIARAALKGEERRGYAEQGPDHAEAHNFTLAGEKPHARLHEVAWQATRVARHARRLVRRSLMGDR